MDGSLVHIAPAFIKAKREFGPALKDRTNPAYKSKYADLGACLDAVDDALLNNGIAVMHVTFPDDSGVTVETVFLHESGESIRGGKLHFPSAKHDPQGYASALTYCRRNSLMAACGIAPEDDDGNAASAKPPAQGKAQQPKPAAATEPKPDLPPVTKEMIATHISAMEATKTLPALQDAFAAAWRITQHAPEVKKVYDRLKTIMEAGKE